MTQRNERPASRFSRNAGRFSSSDTGAKAPVSDSAGAAMEAASTPGSTPNSVPGREAPTLVLITRTGCHLCADAHAVMRAVSAQTGLPVHEVEIDSDPALLEAFRDDIPVLLINGQIHSRWHLDVSEITGSLGTL